MSEIKRRTITITGPFSEDQDGDLRFEHPTSGCWGYVEVPWMKTWPGVTVTVEDAPRELPTQQGAVIRATVTTPDGDAKMNSLLILDDIDDRPWRSIDGRLTVGWFGPEDIGWFGPEDIGDDWVELVPATS